MTLRQNYELVDDRYAGYNLRDIEARLRMALESFNVRISHGKTESESLVALENDWGVRVEHLR